MSLTSTSTQDPGQLHPSLRQQLPGAVIWLAVLFLFLCGSRALAAEPIPTLIVVPKATGAAKEIYSQVVNGVVSNTRLQSKVIEIEKDSGRNWLAGKIREHDAELVVPIGNKSYKLCHTLYQQQDGAAVIVAGGISGKPNGIPTLSLTGSPQSTLSEVKRHLPKVQDIRLVYSEALNGWWYRQAKQVGSELGIEVIGYEARNLQEGVKLYEQLMSEANKQTSAVWIPLKSIVPSKTILPMVLEKAWMKKLPVISNNPSHTRLGSLMAFYPHHYLMGQQLANYAVSEFDDIEQPTIIGTDALKSAVNVRTGSHLGLRFDKEELERFDKVFPVMR